MTKKIKTLILGRNGMLGSALFNSFSSDKIYEILSPSSKELDLTDEFDVQYYIRENKPDLILNAAGLVKGLYGNMNAQRDMYEVNKSIGLNVAKAVKIHGGKLIYFSSSCVYPAEASLPYKEEDFKSNGFFNPDNAGYAAAKAEVSGFILDNNLGIVIVPPNLFGVRRLSDVKKLEELHMLETFALKNALCRKIDVKCSPQIRREILSAKQLAKMILIHWERLYNSEYKLINIGPGESVSIREICNKFELCFATEITYDSNAYSSLSDKYMNTSRFTKITGEVLRGWTDFIDYIHCPFSISDN